MNGIPRCRRCEGRHWYSDPCPADEPLSNEIATPDDGLSNEVVAQEPKAVTQAMTNAQRQAKWRQEHPEQHRVNQRARWQRRAATLSRHDP